MGGVRVGVFMVWIRVGGVRVGGVRVGVRLVGLGLGLGWLN